MKTSSEKSSKAKTKTNRVVIGKKSESGSADTSKRWYIVHAYSNYENFVMHALAERVASLGVENKFEEIVVPTEEVVEMRGGQKRKSERKFFPGYVLVKMEMDDETWHLVRKIPKVLGFIGGTNDKP